MLFRPDGIQKLPEPKPASSSTSRSSWASRAERDDGVALGQDRLRGQVAREDVLAEEAGHVVVRLELHREEQHVLLMPAVTAQPCLLSGPRRDSRPRSAAR